MIFWRLPSYASLALFCVHIALLLYERGQFEPARSTLYRPGQGRGGDHHRLEGRKADDGNEAAKSGRLRGQTSSRKLGNAPGEEQVHGRAEEDGPQDVVAVIGGGDPIFPALFFVGSLRRKCGAMVVIKSKFGSPPLLPLGLSISLVPANST